MAQIYRFKETQSNRYAVFLPTDDLKVRYAPTKGRGGINAYTMERISDSALIEITVYMFRNYLQKQ